MVRLLVQCNFHCYYREYLKELLETASESGQKFLLFAHHTNVMDALEQEIRAVSRLIIVHVKYTLLY